MIHRKLELVNGAIAGTEAAIEQFDKIVEEHRKKNGHPYFTVSSGWVREFLEYRLKIWKNIKMKTLEEIVCNKK